MKINFGGVKGEKEGFVNVGLHPDSDKFWNLDHYPLPFFEESIDETYCSHTLEHLKEPLMFLEECQRIMKPGVRMTIRVPHCSAHGGAFGSMEHRWFFHENAIGTVTWSDSALNPYLFKHISTKVIRARFLKWRKYEIVWVIEK